MARPTKPVLRSARKAYKEYKKAAKIREYDGWASQNENECFVFADLAANRLFSVIVPVFNTHQTHLLKMVYSVINQHYQNWELVLVNASTDPERIAAVDACAQIDTRIKVIKPGKNLGISGNTNYGVGHAGGDYIVFFDHDDMLHPCALHAFAEEIHHSSAELLYSDEDKITHDGSLFFDPHFKPRWSPDLLNNVNYINHLTAIKAEFVKQAGGLDPAHDGAQDYDLLLRVIDKCQPKIKHVPHVLYHWRAANTSTAQDISNKTYIFKAGESAIGSHLHRIGAKARVKAINGRPGFYRVAYHDEPDTSLVIGPVSPNMQRVCAGWLQDLLKKAGPQIKELVIGDWYKPFANAEHGFELHLVGKDNYWPAAAAKAKGEVVMCIQQAVMPSSEADVRELAAVAIQPGCLACAPMVLDAQRAIADSGLVASSQGLQPLFRGYKAGDGSVFGSTEWVRNIDALSGGIFCAKAEVFKKLTESATHKGKLTAENFLKLKEHMPGNIVIWSHVNFELDGELVPKSSDDTFFNPQLGQASFEINIAANSWGHAYERSES